jgi:putative lipoic acid-binding regulatory protein
MPIGATFFVTWRLFGSIPAHILKQIDAERTESFRQLDSDKRKSKLTLKEINIRKYTSISISMTTLLMRQVKTLHIIYATQKSLKL